MNVEADREIAIEPNWPSIFSGKGFATPEVIGIGSGPCHFYVECPTCRIAAGVVGPIVNRIVQNSWTLAEAQTWADEHNMSRHTTEKPEVEKRPHWDFAVKGCDCGRCYGEEIPEVTE